MTHVSDHRRRTFLATALLAAALVGALPRSGAAATVNVSTAAQLQAAVANAASGDQIVLAPGTYNVTTPLIVQTNITLTGPTTSPGATITGPAQPDPNTLSSDLIDVSSGVSLSIQNLALTGTMSDGAAVSSLGPVTFQESTVSAGLGDGLFLDGSGSIDTLRNSTVSGNAGTGVILGPNNTLNAYNDTIANNGGGIGNFQTSEIVNLTNTIVYGNTTYGNCLRLADQDNHSMDGDGTCFFPSAKLNPLLAPLGNYGGPTPTRALLSGSPAIDAGTNSPCPATDQRGVARSDGHCDVGAYEFGSSTDTTPPVITVPGPISSQATGPIGAPVTYAVTFSDPDDPVASSGCSPAPGTWFPVGTTTVTCTATDSHGNSSSKPFSVTVTLGTASGLGCQQDGQISGRGGELFGDANAAFANSFRDDYCGRSMAIFNYDSLTGSTIGQQAASCRTDAFAASDIPYDNATLASLNSSPGFLDCSPFGAVTPTEQPAPAPYPDSHDATAPIMSFPVGGSAVALGVNLQAADCGGTKPTTLQFTASMLSHLFSGEIKSWNDPSLQANGLNAGLSKCGATRVTRVVRADDSSATQALKDYLVKVDGSRSLAACGVSGDTWTVYAASARNTDWPSASSCSPLVAGTGSAGALSACNSTHGAICFADLPDMISQPSITRPSLRNSTDTAWVAPVATQHANCSFATLQTPGGGSINGSVGLSANDTWATDNATGNYGDVTYTGSLYPICRLTFALVYTGLLHNGLAVARLTYDQRQTLYSYFSYLLSQTGQDKLESADYQELPTGAANLIRTGFRANS